MTSDCLSDVELRAKLAKYGYPVGPVTQTTRKILVDKLRKLTEMRDTAENHSGDSLAPRHNLQKIEKIVIPIRSNLNLENDGAWQPNLNNHNDDTFVAEPNLKDFENNGIPMQSDLEITIESHSNLENLENAFASQSNLENLDNNPISCQHNIVSIEKTIATRPANLEIPENNEAIESQFDNDDDYENAIASLPTIEYLEANSICSSEANVRDLEISIPSQHNLSDNTIASQINPKNALSDRSNLKKFKNTTTATRSNLKISPILLFFDLETSGLEIDCDVLQIAIKSSNSSLIFERYIDPVHDISPEASRINNLYNRSGHLYRNDVKLDSQPLSRVLDDMLVYLKDFGNKCVLVAHNAPFDAERLVNAMIRESREKKFARFIDGFTDTLEMFRDKYPHRRWIKGSLTLSNLVKESLDLSTEGAHDAAWDASMLEKLAFRHFTEEQLLSRRKSYKSALRQYGKRG